LSSPRQHRRRAGLPAARAAAWIAMPPTPTPTSSEPGDAGSHAWLAAPTAWAAESWMPSWRPSANSSSWSTSREKALSGGVRSGLMLCPPAASRSVGSSYAPGAGA